VGARILENGGNAVDAAAAIQFALNVVEPNFSGIGGGGFMMVHMAGKKRGRMGETFFLDIREKAPAAATSNMFVGVPSPANNGIAVGVPGTLLGVATALNLWGTISLSDTLQPAIKLAEEGFRVTRVLASDTENSKTLNQPETRAVFRRPNGARLERGDLLVQPDLAQTFKLIALQGPDVFYRGEIAAAIVEAQKRTVSGAPVSARGRMALADLDMYDVKFREPIVANYRGYTVVGAPPPSSGGLTVMQMLKMLKRFPLGDESQGFGFGTAKTLHVMIEAMRLAFADRAFYMGDEDFVPVPKAGLLADGYVQLRSSLIHEDSRMSTPSAGDPWPFDSSLGPQHIMLAAASIPQEQNETGHTTHFSVVDKWNNIVTYTTTIEAGWGTGIMVPGYGFLLNNELTDFNTTPAYNPATGNPGANDAAPFKRPRSSIAPTILLKDGKPFAAFGSPGGATIINSVLQIILNLIDHDMTIQEAIDAPRISVTSATGTLTREEGFSYEAVKGLADLGHNVPSPSTIGSVQAVIVDLRTGKQYGGADSRRQGTVIGLPRCRPVSSSECHRDKD
jgi:gamma-glutamyltranspeptidase/glutathione hydrolase